MGSAIFEKLTSSDENEGGITDCREDVSIFSRNKQYQQISYQLFGGVTSLQLADKSEAQKREKCFKLPFVDLTTDKSKIGLETSAKCKDESTTAITARPLEDMFRVSSCTGGERKVKQGMISGHQFGLFGRCLICYSLITPQDKQKLLGQPSRRFLPARTKEKAEELINFLRILSTAVPSLSTDNSTAPSNFCALFENALQHLRVRPWCLCETCNSASQQLLSKHGTLQRLQIEISELKQKIFAAIKLSKVLSEKDPSDSTCTQRVDGCCQMPKTTGKAKYKKTNKLSLRMQTINRVRRYLLGGKWTSSQTRQALFNCVHINRDVKRGPELTMDLNLSKESEEAHGGKIETVGEESTMGCDNDNESETHSTPLEDFGLSVDEVDGCPDVSSEVKQEKQDVIAKNSSIGDPNDIDGIGQSQSEGGCTARKIRRRTPYGPKSKRTVAESKPGAQTEIGDKVKHERERKNAKSRERYNKLREQFPDMTYNQIIAHQRKRRPTWNPFRKGLPGLNTLPISQLKSDKRNQAYIKVRMAMDSREEQVSQTVYRQEVRETLSEQQKVIGDQPSRGNMRAPGLKRCRWDDKGRTIHWGDLEVKRNDEGRWTCPLCVGGVDYATKIGVTLHLNNKHLDLSNAYTCEQCDAKFYYHRDLCLHIQEKHGGGYQCEICGDNLANRSTLFYHKRVKHQGIKPNVCEHCGKGFATKKDLTIHVRRHTGERPFVCDVCAGAFIDKQALKHHMRRKHPDIPV